MIMPMGILPGYVTEWQGIAKTRLRNKQIRLIGCLEKAVSEFWRR